MTLAELERRIRAAGVSYIEARPVQGAWRITAVRYGAWRHMSDGDTLEQAAENLLAKLEDQGAGKCSYSPPVDPEGYPSE